MVGGQGTPKRPSSSVRWCVEELLELHIYSGTGHTDRNRKTGAGNPTQHAGMTTASAPYGRARRTCGRRVWLSGRAAKARALHERFMCAYVQGRAWRLIARMQVRTKSARTKTKSRFFTVLAADYPTTLYLVGSHK